MTRRCPLCRRQHEPCQWAAGRLACVNGDDCANPHHQRAPAASLCDYCGGLLRRGELIVQGSMIGEIRHVSCRQTLGPTPNGAG